MLYMLGTSHRESPVAFREQLAFSSSDLQTSLEVVREHRAGDVVAGAELAILSTCNRTELYFAPRAPAHREQARTDGEVWEALILFLARTRGLDSLAIEPWLYRRAGTEAVRHLCQVAAGLDSMVVGETEILGQVGRAQDAAAGSGTLGDLLAAAFRCALRAGRRARAETGISRRPASVSSETVALICDEAGPLAEQRILLVGTGRVARSAGEALRERGAVHLHVVSRTSKNAERLASDLDAMPVLWCDLANIIGESDVVLSATSAPHAVLTTSIVSSAITRRSADRPLLFIDAAVPRDIESEVGTLSGVRLFDFDDLQARIRGNLNTRRLESPQVEEIINQEVETFEEWQRGAALRPLLRAMRQRAEEIRLREFERLLRRVPDLPDDARREVEQLSRALVNKLLHEPTVRLREEADPALRGYYAQVASHLFAIGEPPSDQSAISPDN